MSLVTYGDGKERVFKPESPGRVGMEFLFLSKDYAASQQVANLNLAVQDAAGALDANDVMPKCSVGCHDGQYGLFMEKAPGVDPEEFNAGKKAPGCLSRNDVDELPPERLTQVAGNLMRGLNRLEWLDLVAGQGDRHGHNYFVAIRPDLSVSVKGIDNDQSFPAYRTGLRTYRLEGDHAKNFKAELEKLVGKYPSSKRDDVRAEFLSDPGLKIDDDAGTVTIDTSKITRLELHTPAYRTIGMHGASLPTYIDEEMCNSLLALKAGEKREAYLANLARRLSPDAVASAKNRLDEAIALAERYRDEGRVVSKEDFCKPEVQKRLLEPELSAPGTKAKPVAGCQLNSKSVNKDIARQTSSFFYRDFFKAFDNPGWYV